MKHRKVGVLLACVGVYFLLKYIIPYGGIIIYPINLLVTFLHEFGHSIGAIISGGDVKSIQVNSDGSGVAITSGGWRSIVLMGGYIGSAIFGNILLYLGFRKEKQILNKQSLPELTLYGLSAVMLFSGIFWYSGIMSLFILLLLSAGIIAITYKTNYDRLVLQFLGVASLAYIIEDFNVGPSSDISKFSEIFIIIPQSMWMIIWLILVIVITFYNLKLLLKK